MEFIDIPNEINDYCAKAVRQLEKSYKGFSDDDWKFLRASITKMVKEQDKKEKVAKEEVKEEEIVE